MSLRVIKTKLKEIAKLIEKYGVFLIWVCTLNITEHKKNLIS